MLTIRGLSKAYAAPVLVDADLEVRAGEVHALMGANGAGKSTLVRIVCGLTPADAGTMTLAGVPYAPSSRRAADTAGVQVVLQELNLVASLSVAENLFLARLPHRFGIIDRAALRTHAVRALNAVGLGDLDPLTPVHRLGIGQQQLVEIAAALTRECRVLVLDEPTAALSAAEVERLFGHIRRLREQGLGILYITHRTDEIRRIADRVTVLRDGRVVDTRAAASFDHDVLLGLTVGPATARSLTEALPTGAPSTCDASRGIALRVHGLSRGHVVRDVSFEVGIGEIVGLSGLVGAGRTETLRLIFGADLPDAGHVCLGDGPPLHLRSPADAVRAGIGLLPEDRRTQALLLTQPVRANITLASMARVSRGRTWIDASRETQAASALATRLDVRRSGLEQVAGTLSGGNQQKTVLARWLLRDCAVLLVDEPTRGIDVGAKHAIHRQLRELAARGTALVVVSSELEELMALCDRIVVLSAGRVTGRFARADWSEDVLMQAAFAPERQS
ncbi:sugar ABC transporter ATP-binding protein [Luteitalea sp. TBR-22]|uniref:sugar ABC transporter ATP-binding protein n=1 Tax=Luteitalea sp. TBR-22 TaxID=2802971 RepID=UPI001AF81D48|nr:sugar ABC transporter ATP-binding protein [Luteitalea sp. TBR-22]BCS35789.1 sugar ABC transporter ATP-binding protein [Luteitalea sp. TBR-22]